MLLKREHCLCLKCFYYAACHLRIVWLKISRLPEGHAMTNILPTRTCHGLLAPVQEYSYVTSPCTITTRVFFGDVCLTCQFKVLIHTHGHKEAGCVDATIWFFGLTLFLIQLVVVENKGIHPCPRMLTAWKTSGQSHFCHSFSGAITETRPAHTVGIESQGSVLALRIFGFRESLAASEVPAI
ncbi:hypothetical protein P691DRAFT_134786 [Macrolepiota fuliginosa MF-IS2]|uniref:Uncharacterized protein n=1 Tax=Macrolepiota fuliginosa MF-IS2 TaxID=1400762 RepID=A0A9P5XKA7_9AGAR|nr:hypothetical protein P691DRAFT_134786 [Macrolepiota fuliginosa MF-IS2]